MFARTQVGGFVPSLGPVAKKGRDPARDAAGHGHAAVQDIKQRGTQLLRPGLLEQLTVRSRLERRENKVLVVGSRQDENPETRERRLEPRGAVLRESSWMGLNWFGCVGSDSTSITRPSPNPSWPQMGLRARPKRGRLLASHLMAVSQGLPRFGGLLPDSLRVGWRHACLRPPHFSDGLSAVR